MAGRLEIGDDSAQITAILQEDGVTCPVGALDHLRGRVPGNPSPAALEATLERLRRETAVRRVVPLPERPRNCAPAGGATEIGVDRAGRVLWIVSLSGRAPVRLPDEFMAEPSGETGA